MSSLKLNPQNPYISCVVRASAGCGKTYQLSRRFLFLVAAGACPTTILTITFTKKAAAEMRERILEESSNLLQNESARTEFDQAVKLFYKDALAEGGRSFRPPLSAKETARKILSSTQGLKISTIDSTFLDWVKKFPVESQGGRLKPIPAQAEMASESQSALISKIAWEKVCVDLFENDPSQASILPPLEIEKRIQGLQRNQTFFWLAEQRSGNAFCSIPIPEDGRDLPETEEELVSSLRSDLLSIAESINPKKRDLVVAAITTGSLEELIQLKLLTKDLKISGATIRGKKRDALAAEIFNVDTMFSLFRNFNKIGNLNQIGSVLCRLFSAFSLYRDQIKDDMGLMEFEDMAKGCYSLFSNPYNLGARFLIHQQVKHLMLDEFQDTSSLQWAVFKSIAEEMLAGEGLENKDGTKSSLFIVGDEKQSIYGFREADSSILLSAADELRSLGVVEIPLNHSYRTSQIVLDTVNGSFSDLIDGFPEHATARFGETGPLAVPNIGSVAISPLFEDKDAIEEEAEFTAKYLQSMINAETPVYDKTSKGYRPLQARDCAILYRASTHVPLFEKCLRDLGIESRREENRGFFDRQEVRDLIHVLEFLCFPSNLLSFSAMIRSPLSPIPEDLLLDRLNHHCKRETPEAVARACLEDFSSSFPHFTAAVKQLLVFGEKLSPSDLIVQVFQFLNPIGRYKKEFVGAEGAYSEANLQKLLDLTLEFQQQGYVSLQTILERFHECAKEDILGTSAPSENAVNLMTIHKSKGLEFPLVVVIGLGEAWEKRDPYWVKQNSKSKTGLSYVGIQKDRPLDDDSFDKIYQKVLDEDKQENMRLLYVALTRAKHHLLLTGGRRLDSKKDHGFHNHLHKAIERLGAKETKLDETSYISFNEGLSKIETKIPQVSNESASLPSPINLKSKAKLEVKTLAPNRLLSKSDLEGEDLSVHIFQPYSKEAGTFIHKILELEARHEKEDLEAYWQGLFPGGKLDRFGQVGMLAREQATRVVQSDLWQTLVKQSGMIKTELDIVHLDGDMLIRGSIDLLLQMQENQFLCIDYKTTSPVPGTSFHDLALAKGYDRQVLAYVKAIKALYSGAKVNGAVYFTQSNQLTLTHQEYDMSTLWEQSPLRGGGEAVRP